jgi:hypothetical protein
MDRGFAVEWINVPLRSDGNGLDVSTGPGTRYAKANLQ